MEGMRFLGKIILEGHKVYEILGPSSGPDGDSYIVCQPSIVDDVAKTLKKVYCEVTDPQLVEGIKEGVLEMMAQGEPISIGKYIITAIGGIFIVSTRKST